MDDQSFNLDEWLDDYQPVVVEVKIVQKAALIADHQRLQAEYMRVRVQANDVMHDSDLAAVEADLRACEAEIVASEKTFTFQGVGHAPWQELKRRFPPTKDQREEGDDVDLERWAPAAIAQCSLNPKITIHQAETMMRKLPPGEFDKVMIAVRSANSEVIGAPKSALVAHIDKFRRNGGLPTTGLRAASQDVDSSGTLADRLPESPETTSDE